MKDTIDCLSPDILEQLTRDEIAPDELDDIERHVTDCRRCRQLFDGVTNDVQWSEDIRPVLQKTAIADSTQPDGDEHCGTASILQLLGPTDDPHMLGRIGIYEVVGVVGQGGMGVVFKAFDAALDRFVAIKMLLPHLAANGAARQRFSREARAVAAVVDDHVLPIYGVDEWHEIPYLVMQYSRGTTLQKRIEQQGPLELKEVLRIGLQTARGLAAAHAQGLVHRDVKPANILLDGSVERAMLTDFGLARAADDASITRSGIVAGTPQYMSPEQVRGESVDARSDLFSLGSTMYAMCTGRSPFRSETAFGVMHRLTHDEPTSICEINPDIPAWLAGIVERLLAKKPEERFESASEVARLLEECLAHVQQPTSVPRPKLCDSLECRAATHGKRGGSFFRSPVVRWVAAFLFFVVFGTVIVLELNKGTLRIESRFDDVAVRIMQGEKVVRELTVSRNGTAVRIAAGNYVVEIEGETDDIVIKGGTITLMRGATEVASIVQAEKPGKRDLSKIAHGRFSAVVEKIPQKHVGANGATESDLLQLRAFIGQSMIRLVPVGNPATIKIDALPTTVCAGKVTAVMRIADPPMRNGMPGLPFVAIIAFDTKPKLLKPGMTGEVDIELPTPDTKTGIDNGFNSERRVPSAAPRIEKEPDDGANPDVRLEVIPDIGVMILRGENAAVKRTAKELSDVLEKKTNLPDQSKQDPGENRSRPRSALPIDTNGDSNISQAEFPGTSGQFNDLDRDADGVIDRDERSAR